MDHAFGTLFAVGIFILSIVAFTMLPWIARAERRHQRRAVQSGTIGSIDEIFHPTAYEAQQFWNAQTELPAPAPLPGDKMFENNTITLTLPPRR